MGSVRPWNAGASVITLAALLAFPTTAIAQTSAQPSAKAPAQPPAEAEAKPPAAEADTAGPTLVAPEQAEASKDIVVTGSRVRGAVPVGSTVISMGREQINASGTVTLDRMIREIPQVFDLGVSENSRAQGGGAGNIVYGNTVNIRGIGPYATLVLVDGHRVVNNSRSTDPSVLPSLGVERVEVFADGGSAIYGSDAIAGVVNLIPRRNLNGVEAVARYGQSTDDGFSEWQVGAAAGKTWHGGQAMIAYEHVYRSNLSGDDRDFFRSDQRAFGGGDYRITRCDPGNVRIGSAFYPIPNGGVTPANASSLVAGTANRCEEFVGQDLFPQQEYDSVNATFSQDITPWLTVFGDGFWSKRTYERHPAYATLNNTPVPATNAFYVAPAGVTPPVCANTVTGVPAGTRCINVDYSFLRDLPINVQTGMGRSWQVTPGIRVKLPHDWQFEGIYGYGKTKDTADSFRGLNSGAIATALRSTDPATALDVFGLHRTSAATLLAISNMVSFNPTLARFKGGEARLNGTLFSLPGGDVKLALGYERQDQVVDLGRGLGVAPVTTTFRTFDRTVDSEYAQIVVPLFGPNNAIPGFRRLDIDAAIRHDKYSDVGKTTNPKLGVSWSPLAGLTFRGNWGTSFRAPLISQIYGNSNNLFVQNYSDPTQGGASVQGVALSGVNLDLKPEEAHTWSLGADWSPIHNMQLGFTYWNVKYQGQVNAVLSDLTVLRNEAAYAGTGIILRGPAAAARTCELVAAGVQPTAPLPGGSCNTVTLFVDGRNFNLGNSVTRGIDFQALYRVPTDSLGQFTFNASGTYITKYTLGFTPTAAMVNRLNYIFNPLRFKARGSVLWDYEPFRVQLTANHVGGYKSDILSTATVVNVQKVKSYTPVDLSLNMRIGDPNTDFGRLGANVGVEIRNMFNTKPPYVNIAPTANGSGGYDASIANPIGRQVSLVVRTQW